MSKICVAQYNLRITCEQFWQHIPENCVEAWNDRAACSIVYAYGKLYEAKEVPSASDRLRMLQRKLVAHHATEWDAQGVSNVAWSLSKQELLLGEAEEPLMRAILRVSDSMNAQGVANTLCAIAKMNLDHRRHTRR
jgi:hypothetical protein